MDPADLVIRPLLATDSFEEITGLLHRSYKGLAGLGFRYYASHQDAQTTRDRAGRGDCWVGVSGGRILATICLRRGSATESTPHYRNPDVFIFGQFAVDPSLQGHGIGSRLLDLAENRAREMEAREIACDTAEGAAHLVQYYEKRGYRFVGHVQWDRTIVNYRSVILSKRLG